ncbi:MAG: hypothetical protein L6R30_15290 [Thermoanaerobaculia bacterium]|nr:hypothetical protein [Thermoanaerobaculia bacterium]
MTVLRWVLGTVAIAAAVGWLGLCALSSRFRESFGASAVAASKFVALPAGLGLVLFSVLFPELRWLLHATAVLVGGTVIASLWLLPRAPVLGSLGLLYSALWFGFYAGIPGK